MDVESLSRVERLDPRDVWSHEAHEFTPWLEANIDALAEKIGIELEIGERESRVGDFSADLVGHDLTTNAAIVIENQLAPTDHSHLGQLITYAAGLDTKVQIWVSTEIREEHRQAVDWLNDVTREEYSFFAIRVELLKVGEGVAPDFVVVASPNAWQKQLKAASKRQASGGDSDGRYKEIWGRFIERLNATDSTVTRARTGANVNWFQTTGGFVVSFSRQGPCVQLYLDEGEPDATKALYDRLFESRAAIEAELGEELSWERLDDKQASRIALYTTGSARDPNENIGEILDWFVAKLLGFRAVFPAHVALAREGASSSAGPSVETAASASL